MTAGPIPDKLYRIAFEHSHLPLVLLDRSGFRFCEANPAFCELTGYSRSELLTLRLPDLYPPEYIHQTLPANTDTPFSTDIQLVTREGAHFIASLSCNAIEAEELSLYLAFVYSSSHAVQSSTEAPEQQALERENQELKTISQRKSELIANISHELRTPLTAILGWPEIILDTENAPEVAVQAALSIQKDGEILMRLLEDLIDISKIEAGRMELDIREENLGADILNALEILKTRAYLRHITLSTDLPEQPVYAMIDPLRITQVILNYLSNALKFTPEGGHVCVHLVSEEPQAVVSVSDNGVGLAPEALEVIFERFVRADSGLDAVEGTGIGLSLVKSLVELHNGQVWVESIRGQGSTFSFSVPLAIDHEDLAPSQNALTDWPQHPLHILLSDSRLDTLFILRNLLQHEHIRVTSTHELSETLALAVGDLPDVVLLDTSVTAGDSYRVLSALQAHPQTQHIPVIAVTASAMKGDREQLLALGYRGYVAKPCTRRTLLQSIHDALA